MQLTVITPAYNSMPALQSCIASVRAQVHGGADLSVVHHVQDGSSNDGTSEFLGEVSGREAPDGYRLAWVTEPDDGMYDALNRAFSATRGEVLGHLNADEQYLPGTLEFVERFFRRNPKVDILFGAVVVVDPAGRYICSRLPMRPRPLHTRVCHLSTFTAATFYRRSSIEALGAPWFDTSFKTVGDADLMLRLIDAGLTMATTRRYLSTFIDSGDNLALSPIGIKEQRELRLTAPAWAVKTHRVVEAAHRVRKLLHGAYLLPKFSYRFIQPDGSSEEHLVRRPTGRWRR